MLYTKSQLITTTNTNLPDNSSGLISPADLREVLIDIINSDYNIITNANSVGLGEWNNGLVYSSGGGVIYNDNIYKAIVSATTPTSFVTSEWLQISDKISTTAGLGIYALKQNVIELDNSKFIPSLSDDFNWVSSVTGFYQVNAVASPVGLNQLYPVIGKALLKIFRRVSTTETIFLYTPYNDLSTYYIKKSTDANWTKVVGGIIYTAGSGITISGTTINQGGTFHNITLTGSYPSVYNLNSDVLNYNSSSFNLTNHNNININSNSINIHGTFAVGNTISNLNNYGNVLNLNGKVAVNDLQHASNINNDYIVSWNSLNNQLEYLFYEDFQGTNGIEASNGLHFTNNVIKLGGQLSEMTKISDESDIEIINFNNRILSDENGTVTVDWNNYSLSNISGKITVDWNSSELKQLTTVSVDWGARLLIDSSNINSMDYDNRVLFDATGSNNSIDYGNRFLFDASGINSINYDSRLLIDSSFQGSLEYQNRLLIDAAGNNSMDWNNRILYQANGTSKSYDYSKNITYYSDGSSSGNFNNGTLYHQSNFFVGSKISIDYSNSYLYNASGVKTLDWTGGVLFSNTNQSIDWGNRYLRDDTNTIIADWISGNLKVYSNGLGTSQNSSSGLIFTNNSITINQGGVGKIVVLDDNTGNGGVYIRGLAGGNTKDTCAVLQLNSHAQGFIPPVMSTSQKNAISSPTQGLTVFDNTLKVTSVYNGSTWTDNGIHGQTTLIAGAAMVANSNITTSSYAITTFSSTGISTSVPITYTAGSGFITFSTGQPTDTATFAYHIYFA